jgi:hypothetical protein
MKTENELEAIIQALKLAQFAGFSSQSSPVVPLLEAGIDLSLALRRAFLEEDRLFEAKANPEIKFLDNEKADSLGNTKSVKVFKPRKFRHEPEAAKIFTQLALFFVLTKTRPIGDSFMESFKEWVEVPKNNKRKVRKNLGRFFYYRRNSKRLSNQKHRNVI